MPANYPTLMDVARRSGDPSISNIVEILNKSNPLLDDIPWIECNSGVTHITTMPHRHSDPDLAYAERRCSARQEHDQANQGPLRDA